MRVNRLFFTLALTFSLAGAAIPFRIAVAEKLQAQDPAIFYEQGLGLFKAEKFEEAVKAFKQAIKLKPDYVDAYYRLGETFYEMDEFKKAAETYKELVRYQPDSALAYSKLGAAYNAIADHKKAIDAYREAIRLDPKTSDLHYKLGVIYALQDKEKANAEYKILQPLDPKLAQDLYNLIYQPPVTVVADGAVRLNAVALDSGGAAVKGLTTDDFQVLEEGVPQAISVSAQNDAPIVYGIAVDASGSVRPVFSLLIGTLKVSIDKTLPQDETMLIRFISSDKLETVQDFTTEKKKLAKAIDTLYIEGGQSAVVDAVYVTAQRVASYKFPQSSMRRVLLLLTDGEDRASYYSSEQLLKLLRGIDVQIFAISFANQGGGKLNQNQPRKSVELLQQLTSSTGGKAFFPTSVAELKTAIDQVFDMIHAEYAIQYKPTKPIEAGVYRPVKISILPKPGRENWTVTSRSGYLFSAK